MANPTTSMRLPEHVADYLATLARLTADGRQLQPGAMAPRAIEQLMLLQRAELERFPLALGEATLLADVMNGSTLDRGAGSLLAMELSDAVLPTGSPGPLGGDLTAHYERHHDLPAGAVTALIARLRSVGPSCDWAIRFALACWWDSGRDGEAGLDATPEGFGAVGLRIVAPNLHTTKST